MKSPKTEADATLHKPQGEAPDEEKAPPSAADLAAHAAKQAKREKAESRGDERDERAKKALRQLTDISEEGDPDMSLRTILGGDILAGRRFRRQLGYLLLLTCLAIVYVTNRYACQREEIRRDELADTLLDRKYKALTISGQLTEYSMRSRVEENLRDTTLRTSTRAAYYINDGGE